MVTPHRGRNGQSGFGGELRLDVASYLTKIEKDIFGILLQAAKSAKSGTVVRVAGGWVRDKLLGLEVDAQIVTALLLLSCSPNLTCYRLVPCPQ